MILPVSYLLFDAKLGKYAGLGRASAAKHLSACAAVVLPRNDTEFGPAPVADGAFCPLGSDVRLKHSAGLPDGRKLPPLSLHQVEGLLQIRLGGFKNQRLTVFVVHLRVESRYNLD